MTKAQIKHLGLADYQQTWENMQEFTLNRTADTPDEFWLLEHSPVFTLGLAGLESHILNKEHDIPIIRTDRGGQVTYHGPGQLIIYTLINLEQAKLSIRELVTRLELGIIKYLNSLGIEANGDRNAPGVYVNNKKIASLGLKVKRGCTYHGISFNIAMDTLPFNYINVCGYSGLKVVQLNDLIPKMDDLNIIGNQLVQNLIETIYG